jgi:nucleoside-diphosphate-sugar epimerase
MATEFGEWARGYALDQRLSSEKARAELGWRPKHCDPDGEIALLP